MTRRSLSLFALSLALLLPAGNPAWADARVPESRQEIRMSFAPVVKRATPAVVNVFSRRVVRAAQGPASLFNDPLFRQFFGQNSPFGMPRERVENSLGSGVILDPSGLIVTNRHVIEGGQEIRIVLSDRREYEAKILLSDERADLAVLKIDPKGEKLPTLPIGDSDQLEVGDLVLAIGDPFGVGQTVTSGIVSALGRTAIGTGDFRSFIQTDAAINPGNSGGPLIDLDGKLVGINTAIFSQSGGSVGIGFAIPSSMVRSVLAAATHGGHIIRPWLGASGQPVTPELAQSLRLQRPQGVLVRDIVPGSPAADAGIRMGDVILDVQGHEIGDPEELRFRIATLTADAKARLSLWRDGQRLEVTAILIPPPENPPRDLTTLKGRGPFSGATVGNLNPAFADELGVDTAKRGVIVKEVAGDSFAAQLGVQPGDILVSINDEQIENVAGLHRAVATPPPWTVTILRGDKRLSVTVRD